MKEYTVRGHAPVGLWGHHELLLRNTMKRRTRNEEANTESAGILVHNEQKIMTQGRRGTRESNVRVSDV